MHNVFHQAELIRVVLGLLFILVLILILSWMVKRLHGMRIGSTKGFHTIASMILGPKEKITLLKVGSRYLLLGIGSGQVTLLYDFGEELPEGFYSTAKPSFAELLQSIMKS